MRHISTDPPNLRFTRYPYLLALLARRRKWIDANGATERVPRSQIVLCAVPHVEFALQRILVPVPRIRRCGAAALPARVPPQPGVRSSWWERRVVVKRWEGAEEDI